MLDLTNLLVPKCITCGSAPVITQKESMEKTAEDDYTEWKPSGNFVLEVECPKCGRTEGDVPFNRIRRITGYLVGTLDRFNDAKRAEERDRVKHG